MQNIIQKLFLDLTEGEGHAEAFFDYLQIAVLNKSKNCTEGQDVFILTTLCPTGQKQSISDFVNLLRFSHLSLVHVNMLRG